MKCGLSTVTGGYVSQEPALTKNKASVQLLNAYSVPTDSKHLTGTATFNLYPDNGHEFE